MPIESEITYFIDNQQIAAGNLLLQLQQPAAIQLSNHFLILVESGDSQLLSVPFSPCI